MSISRLDGTSSLHDPDTPPIPSITQPHTLLLGISHLRASTVLSQVSVTLVSVSPNTHPPRTKPPQSCPCRTQPNPASPARDREFGS